MVAELSIPLVFDEPLGITRTGEPVTVGVPFPKGEICNAADLSLVDTQGRSLPLQAQEVARWSDGSLKWVLLDFLASVEAGGRAEYRIRARTGFACPDLALPLALTQETERIEIHTGPTTFVLGTCTFGPFEKILVHGAAVLEPDSCRTVLTDQEGYECRPSIDQVFIETRGPVRATIRFEGKFLSSQGTSVAAFVARTSFFSGLPLVETKFTIRNPRAAKHSGGLWDLGDDGSVFFKDLSIDVGLPPATSASVQWAVAPGHAPRAGQYDRFLIYQDSSGGSNWNSVNHVNRLGRVPNTFRGYHVIADGAIVEEGERATPSLSLCQSDNSVSAAIESFWQNFPKCLSVRQNCLRIGLFPDTYSDAFELQGGEQKTHTVYLEFRKGRLNAPVLNWTAERLAPQCTPEWYAGTKVFFHVLPRSQQTSGLGVLDRADQLVESAVSGPNSFFARREIIDEYGWRHFGDLYADHEAVGHQGPSPLIAHYNNQYDVIYGALIQYVRSGELKWFRLMTDLAKHVIDIDIYHTTEDRPVFNGGLFWHTEHYKDAATATHRAYSRKNLEAKNPHFCGGGPATEHNYTSGLLHYYYMTGEPTAAESVRELADWVCNMDLGRGGILRVLDPRPRGLCSSTGSRDYHGPGRGAGNSINALIDAHELTGERRYKEKAEELIRRCVHPRDDITSRNLANVELRWSYTAFLQVIGKYLDWKAARNEHDYMFHYAHESLVHYAKWMRDNEVPYSQVLDKVEIPTETWPAQDIRKSNVFEFAAKYSAEPLRSQFLERAEFFFHACITDLLTYRTCTLTRPLVLLITNGYMHAYFRQYPPTERTPPPIHNYDFGQPTIFRPQLYELYKARDAWFTLRHHAKLAGERFTGIVSNVLGRNWMSHA